MTITGLLPNHYVSIFSCKRDGQRRTATQPRIAVPFALESECGVSMEALMPIAYVIHRIRPIQAQEVVYE